MQGRSAGGECRWLGCKIGVAATCEKNMNEAQGGISGSLPGVTVVAQVTVERCHGRATAE